MKLRLELADEGAVAMALGLEVLYARLEVTDADLEEGIGLDDVAVLGDVFPLDCGGTG